MIPSERLHHFSNLVQEVFGFTKPDICLTSDHNAAMRARLKVWMARYPLSNTQTKAQRVLTFDKNAYRSTTAAKSVPRADRFRHRLWTLMCGCADCGLCPAADANFLLRFLRMKKFRMPEAQAVLMKYLKMRQKEPHYFHRLDIRDPAINDLVTRG